MELDLNQEQRILIKSARDFLKKECPKSLVRAMREYETGYSLELWQKIADMGWLGVEMGPVRAPVLNHTPEQTKALRAPETLVDGPHGEEKSGPEGRSEERIGGPARSEGAAGSPREIFPRGEKKRDEKAAQRHLVRKEPVGEVRPDEQNARRGEKGSPKRVEARPPDQSRTEKKERRGGFDERIAGRDRREAASTSAAEKEKGNHRNVVVERDPPVAGRAVRRGRDHRLAARKTMDADVREGPDDGAERCGEEQEERERVHGRLGAGGLPARTAATRMRSEVPESARPSL
jgi:hypothetical protein